MHLLPGITLNIFNKHSDRVKMAALAQMVNVLQSVLLTEGGQMIKTPTYHVMHMYRHHQGADLLESTLTGAVRSDRMSGKYRRSQSPYPWIKTV